jgi:hypothetical protein
MRPHHPLQRASQTKMSIVVRCNPNKEVMEARHQRNRESGEKTSRDPFQQMIMLERRTLQLVCFNKALLLDSLKT